MDRFGAVWRDHPRRVRQHWLDLHQAGDVLLIVGDLSWAMNLEEARDDLDWIELLPGRKVLIKGNHDFWWSGIKKVRAAFGPEVHALQHDHLLLDDLAIVGTRGWQCPGGEELVDPIGPAGSEGPPAYTEQDEKLYQREVARLRLALDQLARSKAVYSKLIVALHYPPMNSRHEPSGFTDLIDQYGVDLCVHGHLHGPESLQFAFEGERGQTLYHCVSADHVEMQPRLLLDRTQAD